MFMLAVVVGVLTGCNRNAGGEDVMARVNGRKITRAEVDTYYNNQIAGAPKQPTPEEADSLRLSILRELIRNEIMMQRAEKLGLLATDDEVDRKVNEAKAAYTQEQFDARLKEHNITIDDFRREVRRNITIDKVINREITSKINISDGDINKYYNEHKAEFNLIEPRYHLARIVVTNQPNPEARNMKAQNDAEARKKILDLLRRLDNGEDFAMVATNFSEQPDVAPSGGDLGYIPESQLRAMDRATFDAISRLKPGQYTGILTIVDPGSRMPVGYQILKLISKEAAGQRDLSDPRVQQAIRQQLRDSREQLLKAAYDESVRVKASIDNYFADSILKRNEKK